ncbi:MAG: hypothetical protein V3U87_15465 [Methylococcaceae bacterium]
MRFWIFKIIFVTTCCTYHLKTVYAKEYSFDIDVNKSKLSNDYHDELSGDDEYIDSVRVGMQASLLPNFLSGSGEFIYDGLDGSSNGGFSGLGKHLLVLGVSGERKSLKYGVNFYSVGHQHGGKFNSKYKNNKGKTGYDSWASWEFKKLLVKASYLESWTTNPQISNHNRTFEQWYKVEASYPLTKHTEVSAVYAVGERNRIFTLDEVKIYHGPLNSLRTKFDYSAKYFDFSSGFNRSGSQNKLRNFSGFKKETVYVRGRLFPKEPLSITSSYRYGISKHFSNIYSKKVNKRESSFGFIYDPLEIPALMKLTSAFKNYQSEDALTERDVVTLGARFDWKLKERNTGLNTNWRLDMQYKDITDHVNHDLDAAFWGVNLSLNWLFS